MTTSQPVAMEDPAELDESLSELSDTINPNASIVRPEDIEQAVAQSRLEGEENDGNGSENDEEILDDDGELIGNGATLGNEEDEHEDVDEDEDEDDEDDDDHDEEEYEEEEAGNAIFDGYALDIDADREEDADGIFFRYPVGMERGYRYGELAMSGDEMSFGEPNRRGGPAYIRGMNFLGREHYHHYHQHHNAHQMMLGDAFLSNPLMASGPIFGGTDPFAAAVANNADQDVDRVVESYRLGRDLMVGLPHPFGPRMPGLMRTRPYSWPDMTNRPTAPAIERATALSSDILAVLRSVGPQSTLQDVQHQNNAVPETSNHNTDTKDPSPVAEPVAVVEPPPSTDAEIMSESAQPQSLSAASDQQLQSTFQTSLQQTPSQPEPASLPTTISRISSMSPLSAPSSVVDTIAAIASQFRSRPRRRPGSLRTMVPHQAGVLSSEPTPSPSEESVSSTPQGSLANDQNPSALISDPTLGLDPMFLGALGEVDRFSLLGSQIRSIPIPRNSGADPSPSDSRPRLPHHNTARDGETRLATTTTVTTHDVTPSSVIAALTPSSNSSSIPAGSVLMPLPSDPSIVTSSNAAADRATPLSSHGLRHLQGGRGISSDPSANPAAAQDAGVAHSQPAAPEAQGSHRPLFPAGQLAMSQIDPEFLAALPPEMREELRIEPHRYGLVASESAQPFASSQVPPDLNAAFPAAALAGQGNRQNQVLSLRDFGVIPSRGMGGVSNLGFIRERNAMRDLMLPSFGLNVSGPLHRALGQPAFMHSQSLSSNAMNGAGPSRLLVDARDNRSRAIDLQETKDRLADLLDERAMLSILRVLFLPQPLNKVLLQRLMNHLAQLPESRNRLVKTILTILLTPSCTSPDPCCKTKEIVETVRRYITNTHLLPDALAKEKMQTSDSSRSTSLIIRRVLEALIVICKTNEQAAISLLKLPADVMPIDGAGKGPSHVYSEDHSVAFGRLVGLLSHPILTHNIAHMELLVQLLDSLVSTVMSSRLPAPKIDLTQESNPITTEQATSAPTVDVDTMQDSSANRPVTSPVAEAPPQAAAPTASHDQQAEIAESTKQTQTMELAQTVEHQKLLLVLPPELLRLLINLFAGNDCAASSFHRILSILTKIAADGLNRKHILDELADRCLTLAKDVMNTMEHLEVVVSQMLADQTPLSSFEDPTLALFGASSKQTSLLRVMKTFRDLIFITAATEGATPSLIEEEAPRWGRLVENMAGLWTLLNAIMCSIGSLHTPSSKPNEHGSIPPQANSILLFLLSTVEAFFIAHAPAQNGTTETGLEHTEVGANTSNVGESSRDGHKHPSMEVEKSAKKSDSFFATFSQQHRALLNHLIRHQPELLESSFAVMLKDPKLLSFDNKRMYFRNQVARLVESRHYPSINLRVRRENVFEDSFRQLITKNSDELKGRISVTFEGEEAIDAGGPLREWYQVLAKEMFNPNYALFTPTAPGSSTFQPNPHSNFSADQDHLRFFKFVGRVIGMALVDGQHLDAHFTRSFYKHMLDVPLDYRDIEAVDPEYYKSICWILEHDITNIMDLTFSVELDKFGETVLVELKENGRNIPVTEANKAEYVQLVTMHRMKTAIQEQIDAFIHGFYEVIPRNIVSIFNDQELELLICGMPEIDVEDWYANTEYQGYTVTSPQIQWFWRVVRDMDSEDRAKLLQFATGTSKVPLDGFKSLHGMNGEQKFSIHKAFQTDRLPSAHTW
eukprot:TRINITY_DN679_c0_g1_i10.p1 TRINITY_DN679_c0_g1~~TRINITY_DN679_c0_g1_i10.p1  ORF type:complete len:1707 (+),score=310.29 TRINITY_DN679_c0_g1_i10:2274-7394(+)